MSKLKEQLMQDMKTAMKEKDAIKKGVITLLRAGITNEEKKLMKELTEDEEIVVIRREQKQTEDSLTEAAKVNRQDIVEAEKAKLLIIESYLPKQLSEEEIRDMLVQLNINKELHIKDVMPLMIKEVAGRAANGVISKVVKAYLS